MNAHPPIPTTKECCCGWQSRIYAEISAAPQTELKATPKTAMGCPMRASTHRQNLPPKHRHDRKLNCDQFATQYESTPPRRRAVATPVRTKILIEVRLDFEMLFSCVVIRAYEVIQLAQQRPGFPIPDGSHAVFGRGGHSPIPVGIMQIGDKPHG